MSKRPSQCPAWQNGICVILARTGFMRVRDEHIITRCISDGFWACSVYKTHKVKPKPVWSVS